MYQKNPQVEQVDIVQHESFADIQELAVVSAIAPHSNRCHM
jgi:hypothetical protein